MFLSKTAITLLLWLTHPELMDTKTYLAVEMWQDGTWQGGWQIP